MRRFLSAIVLGTLALAIPASASLVTSLPGGTVLTIPAANYFGAGPQTFSGVTWTSTNASTQGGAVFGYSGTYGFNGNGAWSDLTMAGLNSSTDNTTATDTMTFTFDTPVSGVGGFLNYVPDASTPTTIAVWDTDGNLIESYDLTFYTGGAENSGFFYGFLESGATIKSFTLTDNYIGITDLTVAGISSTPEPGSAALLGTGMLMLAGLLRRKRQH